MAGPLLDDKVTLITGAAQGIGRATAELFATEGATVVVADIDGDAAVDVTRTIGDAGGHATARTVDVRDPAAVASMRADVLAQFGRLDVLVNNVGHWVRIPPTFVDGDPDHWQALYEVNLLHVLRVTHAFLPSMLERRSGTIINVSSVEGLRGYPPDPVYAAFKAAVVQFTRSLGVELGNHGIKVNGIAPDVTHSEQSDYERLVPAELRHLWPKWVPAGRMGVPDDQARVLLFLASALSDFLVGHTIPTDGGTLAAGGWFRTDRQPRRLWTNRPVDP